MELNVSGKKLGFGPYRPAAVMRITGVDAETFLQGQFTNDIRGTKSEAVYGLWLDQKGKVLADSFALRSAQENEFWLISYFSSAASIRERLEAYVIADDVVIEDQTASWSAVALLGEDSTRWANENAKPGFVFPGRRSRGKSSEWIFPTDKTNDIHQRLVAEKMAELSGTDLEQLRIEAGVPAIPRDIGPGELPNEGGLEVDAISYTKGCYLGQEVMARLKSMGRVRRRLLRVEGTGMIPASLPAPLFLGNRKIGELRSVAKKSDGGFCGLALLSLLGLEPRMKLASAPNGEAIVELVDEP